MVHGAGRNADHYFETATAAGFLAGALENTLIIAPRFIARPDKPQANEVMWPEGGNQLAGRWHVADQSHHLVVRLHR